MATEREWVRNHRTSGYIAGRFLDDARRPMVVIQTRGGSAAIVPEGATIPMTKEEILAQAALDLEPILDALQEGGLSLDDIEDVISRALAYKRAATARA